MKCIGLWGVMEVESKGFGDFGDWAWGCCCCCCYSR